MEGIDGTEQVQISFKSSIKITPNHAITWLREESKRIDPSSPTYYNEILISPKVSLKFPGRHNNDHPGDYLMEWDGKAPTHEEVIGALVRALDENNHDRPNLDYAGWLTLLEDIYKNGTTNLDGYEDERVRNAVEIIFWLTLQEDINQKMGSRLIILCRYAEALATTQKDFNYTIGDVIERLHAPIPETLERWVLPVTPQFYKWSAW